MSELRRHIMMQQSGGLPSEYQRVEYIESVRGNAQFIDSKVECNINITFDIQFSAVGSITYQGWTTLIYTAGYSPIRTDPTNIFVDSTNSLIIQYDNNKHRYYYVNGIPYIDNEQISFSAFHGSAPSGSIKLFYGQSPFGVGMSARVYYYKIYDSGVMVREFIPCYRKTDNVAGMYDLVNREFYTNAGSGEFIIGNPI